MQVFCVGGAVRDELLGLIVKDRDFVVVGSTPDQMEYLNFKPVGKDFPVFLHPKTHEEYALARTERKTGKGYKGFQIHADPSVTLEQDLARRDLTINAIAKDENGHLIDPYGGLDDLKLKVKNGEVDALVPERVWQEIAKGLMEQKPSRMFEVLRECGALQKIMPELDILWGVPQPEIYHPEIDTGLHIMMVIDYAAKQEFSLPIRFAALTHDLGKGTTPKDILPRHTGHEVRGVDLLKEVSRRLRVPNDCKELAQIVAKFHGKVHQVSKMQPETVLQFLMDTDAIRQPQRFQEFLLACECDSRGRISFEESECLESQLLMRLLKAVLAVDAGAVAKKHTEPEAIKQAVFDARLEAIKQVI